MLIIIELQLQLSVILRLLRLYRLEQVLYIVFCQEGAAQYSHDLIYSSVEDKLSFNDCNSAVRYDSHVNLYPNRILSIAPERLDAQVSLHPFEKRLYSPSVFIKEGDVLGFQKEIVGIVGESPFEFRFIIYYSPDFGRIVFSVSLCCEPHVVISEDIIIVFQKVFSRYDLKPRFLFFSYDEERVEHLDTIQPIQIPVATVKNIAGKRLIVNPVHGIHIMNNSFCDIERYWYLSHNIKLCVYLDTGFGTSEPCPFKKRHTEVYGGGIKSVIFPIEIKLLVNTFLLSKSYHIIGELFKNVVIPKLVCLGKHAPVYWGLPKAKVKGLIRMCRSNICQFTKAFAAIQLTKHQNEHLVPVCQTPLLGSIITFFHNESFEVSFGKEIGNLTEKIFATVHCTLLLGLPIKVTISNVRQGFWQNTS